MRDMIRYENVARTKNKIKRQFQGVEFFLTRHVCKYVFTEVRGKTVCFACGELICVFEEYNLNRHSETKHTEMILSVSLWLWVRAVSIPPSDNYTGQLLIILGKSQVYYRGAGRNDLSERDCNRE